MFAHEGEVVNERVKEREYGESIVGRIVLAKEEKMRWKESRKEEKKETQGKKIRQALDLIFESLIQLTLGCSLVRDVSWLQCRFSMVLKYCLCGYPLCIFLQLL